MQLARKICPSLHEGPVACVSKFGQRMGERKPGSDYGESVDQVGSIITSPPPPKREELHVRASFVCPLQYFDISNVYLFSTPSFRGSGAAWHRLQLTHAPTQNRLDK